MCIMKSSTPAIIAQVKQDKVERHQADASLTKNSQSDNEPRGYMQNLKTAPLGLEDTAYSEKKTLLGE